MTSHLYQLYSFTKIRLDSLQRSDDKDAVRGFCRYVRNARILEILRMVEFPEALNVNVPLLCWQTNELEQSAHPSAVREPAKDFAQICRTLEILAGGISLLLTKSLGENRPNNQTRRPGVRSKPSGRTPGFTANRRYSPAAKIALAAGFTTALKTKNKKTT